MVPLGHFNTSHVSINRGCRGYKGLIETISIHLMFLLIKPKNRAGELRLLISIHLMFLLIKLKSAL